MSRARNVSSGNFSRNLKRKVKHWCMAITRHKHRWIIQRRSQRPPSWRRILTKIVHVVHWRYKTIIHVYKLHSEVRMKRGVVNISHGGLGTWVTRNKKDLKLFFWEDAICSKKKIWIRTFIIPYNKKGLYFYWLCEIVDLVKKNEVYSKIYGLSTPCFSLKSLKYIRPFKYSRFEFRRWRPE